MSDYTDYYTSELKELKPTSEYNMSVKIFDGQGNSTKQLDLTPECIAVLIEYLNGIKS
jgi:hypothetical protein